MKSKRSGLGFTIIEVMIVLAVSSSLFIGGMMAFRGQAAQTEFTQTVREFESQLADIVNDVSTGYYQNTGDFACTESGGNVEIRPTAPGSTKLGTNGDCIFVGKVVLFSPQDDPDIKDTGYRVYTLAGLRLNGAKPVKDILEAKPVFIAQSTASPNLNLFPNVYNDVNLGGSIKIKSVKYKNNVGASIPSYGIGIVTTFGSQKDGFLLSGSTNAQLVGLSPFVDTLVTPDHTRNSANFIEEVNRRLTVGPLQITLAEYEQSVIGTGAVEVCVESTGVSPVRYGHITIAGGSRQLKTTSIINGVVCT